MWVQLRTLKQLEVSGKPQMYRPGDWVEIGKQEALRWIAEGTAVAPVSQWKPLFTGCGVLLRGGSPGVKFGASFDERMESLPIEFGEPQICYERTMIMVGGTSFRIELAPIGFQLLDKWQIAIPLCEYKTLAMHLGSDEEKKKTAAVIKDLRVPVYDTRVMFVKHCDEMIELIRQWREEMKLGGDERLDFLRVLFGLPCLVLALPAQWYH